MLRSIGWQELVIVLVIVLILFGPKRLPQLGKTIGKTMRSIRDGVDGKFGDNDDEDEAAVPGKDEAEVKTEGDTKVKSEDNAKV
ncbi:MAG: twin-arginine translocase TatA/TatE family subunit [Coriobacteriia bacterium]|nr:twin-arginine translocase TatA/TatE family subunit [Coriobacteriia bacterium]